QATPTGDPESKPASLGWLFGPTQSAGMRRTLILLLFPSLVLVGTLRYDFVFDDTLVILEDPMVIGTSSLRGVFNQQVQVTDVVLGYYRPITILLYRLDWILWGENPAGYRLTNLLWHLLATFLVYRVAVRTTGRIMAAWAAAMIFALLPAHTESIGWIQGRVDIVATVLGLFAHLSWLRAKERRGSPAWYWGGLSGTAFLAALLVKEVAAALPLAWGVWEVSAIAGLTPSHRRALVRSLVPGACAILLAALTYAVLRSLVVGALVTFPISLSPPGLRALALLVMLAEYGRTLLLPDPTLVFYRPLFVAPSLSAVTVSLSTLLALSGGLIVAWRRARPLFPWIAWIPITLAPPLLFALYAPAPERGFYTAERFLYLPSVGWCLLLGFVVASAYESARSLATSRSVGIALAGLLVGYVGLTLIRLQPWADPIDFYTAMRAQPGLPREMQVFVHNDLGRIYLERGEFPAARAEFLGALVLKPDYALAHNNLGVMFIREGKPGEARRWLEAAIRLDPTHSDTYGNLGAAYEAAGDLVAARRAFEAGLRVAPGSAWLAQGLARVNAEIVHPPASQPGTSR
ncbi:MAG TPA: tetratricopeptide repeat protein, partial [Candidatus Methylomirabilis sp.]|nr:tetratricopeptide repeat protein [Candidatus Methylomirabilis sp.]